MIIRLWLGVLLLSSGFAVSTLHADTMTSDGYSVEDYKLKSAHDLADICKIEAGHPDHAIAVAFCHRLFEGAIHYDEAIEATPAYVDIICSPAGTTRNQAVVGFAAFLDANPKYGSEAPIDAVFRGLSAKRPCPE